MNWCDGEIYDIEIAWFYATLYLNKSLEYSYLSDYLFREIGYSSFYQGLSLLEARFCYPKPNLA